VREYRELRAYYRALADATRLRILGEVGAHTHISVKELSLALGVTQPLVSWHLRILRRARLVATRRQGRQVLCSVNRATIAEFEGRLRALMGFPAGRPAGGIAEGGREFGPEEGGRWGSTQPSMGGEVSLT
jgi:DNA-binding transcriptional ArsR family regulator